jgi:hypothetical protein
MIHYKDEMQRIRTVISDCLSNEAKHGRLDLGKNDLIHLVDAAIPGGKDWRTVSKQIDAMVENNTIVAKGSGARGTKMAYSLNSDYFVSDRFFDFRFKGDISDLDESLMEGLKLLKFMDLAEGERVAIDLWLASQLMIVRHIHMLPQNMPQNKIDKLRALHEEQTKKVLLFIAHVAAVNPLALCVAVDLMEEDYEMHLETLLEKVRRRAQRQKKKKVSPKKD